MKNSLLKNWSLKKEFAESRNTETLQISASFIAVRKTDFAVAFIKEWLHYCCDVEILSPAVDKSLESPEFYDHREDQSILSLLNKKYNIKPYSDPLQYGRLPEKYARDDYIMMYYGIDKKLIYCQRSVWQSDFTVGVLFLKVVTIYKDDLSSFEKNHSNTMVITD